MFRLFGLLLVGLMLAGCQTTNSNLSEYDIRIRNLNNPFWQPKRSEDAADIQALAKTTVSTGMSIYPDDIICAESDPSRNYLDPSRYQKEAKRRGLSCGVGEAMDAQIASTTSIQKKTSTSTEVIELDDVFPIVLSGNQGSKIRFSDDGSKVFMLEPNSRYFKLIKTRVKSGEKLRFAVHRSSASHCSQVGARYGKPLKAKIAILNGEEGILLTGVNQLSGEKRIGSWDNQVLDSPLSPYFYFYLRTDSRYYFCSMKQYPVINKTPRYSLVHQQANWKKLKDIFKIEIASSATTQSNTPSSAELEAERKKRIKLEQQLAVLKAQQEQQQQTISSDTKLPTITIASATTTGAQGIIRGRVNDNTGIAELRIDGQKIAADSSGNFSTTTYVPEGGTSVNIEAIDLAGLSSTMSVRVERAATQTTSISFDRLNPLKRKAAINNDALALVIGVSEYKETNAKAIYADSDAKVFQDYAIEKLGVPRSRVKTLVNDGADEKDMLLATKRWLARASKQGKTDVYIFFAGHGLASDDGSKMYLLPYDGAPELLDKTAILRDELFADISAANPRSVTVFLDTCYSGTTRGTDMLIASRPIAIRALEQSIPDNFTVMTAAAGDQTAKPLEEAKHGMFSYFLMKGMEGEADANNDNEITAGELHEYVQTNVIQQSSGSQTPELQGDADRVLVSFQ
ncbi:caspase family protein [Alphaproteobacteria bacterium]|nr:caspase family protein [Alphaproteobacteria bacterium]